MMKPCVPKKSVRVLAGMVGVVVGLPVLGMGAEWSRFRGADGSGVATDGDPPVTWSDGENLKWKTGREVWKAEAESLELCYGTPVSFEAEGRRDLVLAVPGEIWGMNPETGKLRWFAGTGLSGNISPSIVSGGGLLYANGGFPGLGAVAVRGGGKGDVTAKALIWESKNASYVPSPVLLRGRLYAASDAGFAVCQDAADGRLIFRERLPGAASTGRGGKPFYASAVSAKGRIYAVSRLGGTFVFAAEPEFKLLAHNRIESDVSQCNGTPAIAGRQLLMRSDTTLYCFENP